MLSIVGRIFTCIFSIFFWHFAYFLAVNVSPLFTSASKQLTMLLGGDFYLEGKEAQRYFIQNISSYEENQINKYLLWNALNYHIFIKRWLAILPCGGRRTADPHSWGSYKKKLHYWQGHRGEGSLPWGFSSLEIEAPQVSNWIHRRSHLNFLGFKKVPWPLK